MLFRAADGGTRELNGGSDPGVRYDRSGGPREPSADITTAARLPRWPAMEGRSSQRRRQTASTENGFRAYGLTFPRLFLVCRAWAVVVGRRPTPGRPEPWHGRGWKPDPQPKSRIHSGGRGSLAEVEPEASRRTLARRSPGPPPGRCQRFSIRCCQVRRTRGQRGCQRGRDYVTGS